MQGAGCRKFYIGRAMFGRPRRLVMPYVSADSALTRFGADPSPCRLRATRFAANGLAEGTCWAHRRSWRTILRSAGDRAVLRARSALAGCFLHPGASSATPARGRAWLTFRNEALWMQSAKEECSRHSCFRCLARASSKVRSRRRVGARGSDDRVGSKEAQGD